VIEGGREVLGIRKSHCNSGQSKNIKSRQNGGGWWDSEKKELSLSLKEKGAAALLKAISDGALRRVWEQKRILLDCLETLLRPQRREVKVCTARGCCTWGERKGRGALVNWGDQT